MHSRFSHCFFLQCSVSCGDGVMERTVQCVAADGQESNRCSQEDKPETRKACRNPNCKYQKKTVSKGHVCQGQTYADRTSILGMVGLEPAISEVWPRVKYL